MPAYLVKRFQGRVTLGILDALGMGGSRPLWPTPRRLEVTRASWTQNARSLTVDCLGQTPGSRARHPSLRVVKAGNYDALLTVSIIEESWLAKLLRLGVPTILVDFPNRRFAFQADQVFADPECAYTQAVGHFLAKGFRRIHFVGCEMARPAPWEGMTGKEWIAWKKGREGRLDPDSLLRLAVYWRAMREAGVDVPKHWIHEALHEPDACEALAEKMLAMGEADRPEAIVCHDLAQCRRILRHFKTKGRALEGTGAFETERNGELMIRADPEALGAAAAELLAFRLQRPACQPVRMGVPMVFDAGT
jgi:DNA-binding LacI/PurR family transcriptional regulator